MGGGVIGGAQTIEQRFVQKRFGCILKCGLVDTAKPENGTGTIYLILSDLYPCSRGGSPEIPPARVSAEGMQKCISPITVPCSPSLPAHVVLAIFMTLWRVPVPASAAMPDCAEASVDEVVAAARRASKRSYASRQLRNAE